VVGNETTEVPWSQSVKTLEEKLRNKAATVKTLIKCAKECELHPVGLKAIL
jgi:hypothetical protein